MPPRRRKRHQGPASSAPPTYDRHRFVSEDAYKRYRDSVVRRTLIPERGLQPDPTSHRDIVREIELRKWEDFVKTPEPAVVSVVREFYANLPEQVADEVYVRGKMVSYSGTTINRVYKLGHINDPAFCSLFTSDLIDDELILKTVCRQGSSWKKKGDKKGDVILSIKHSFLTERSKAWLSFVSAKLLPVMHQTDVVLDRILVVYAIMTDLPLDVGSFIHAHFIKGLKLTSKGGLGHPSLITKLCDEAGVCWGPDEELLHPQRPIDEKVIKSYKSWMSPSQAPAPESSSHLGAPLTIEERMDKLEACFKRLEQRSEMHDNRLMNYMQFQSEALKKLLREAGYTQSMAPHVCPFDPPQPFQPFAARRSNDDDDEDGEL